MPKCYGPSVIGATVTKGGHPSCGGLYGTSGTMGRGVAESRGSSVRENVGMWGHTRRINIPTYSTITIGRSYVFKYIVPTIK